MICDGHVTASLFVIIYRYDPKTNQWMDVAPMKVKRKHLGVAVINDELYSVGGRDDSFELSSVERSELYICILKVLALKKILLENNYNYG
jgi:glutaminase